VARTEEPELFYNAGLICPEARQLALKEDPEFGEANGMMAASYATRTVFTFTNSRMPHALSSRP
jgi:hypothetical protein